MAARFSVETNSIYNYVLKGDDDKTYHLYVVVLTTPTGIYTSHVIAYDETEAIAQAHCEHGYEMWKTDKDILASIKVFVKQVPFVIRGWGKNKF